MITQKVGLLEKLMSAGREAGVQDFRRLKTFLTSARGNRPENYINQPRFFWAYIQTYFGVHLPEFFWIADRVKSHGTIPQAKVVCDVGCGPGTATLSYLIWCDARAVPLPKKVVLIDSSSQALDFATLAVKTLFPEVEVQALRGNLRHGAFLKKIPSFDFLIMSHVLNEWGSGPRFREDKRAFVEESLGDKLSPNGWVFVVDPPLREATMDLMWLRDNPFENSAVVAPCPPDTVLCPMMRAKAGWCYAQVPREQMKALGLAPWDRKIERRLMTHLEFSNFSYVVFKMLGEGEHIDLDDHKVRVGLGEKTHLMCSQKKLLRTSADHNGYRGEWVKA